ncbi:hypothetical protein G9A89_013183 [Geosiphon pyriformis]|nr:hypothetical protein G9A89_013183 [Geosiphon pyriformis]
MQTRRRKYKITQRSKMYEERKTHQAKHIIKKHKHATLRNASNQVLNFQEKLNETMFSEPLHSESELEENVTHIKKKQKMEDRELPFSKDDVDKETQESLGAESTGVVDIARGLDEELDDELDDEEGFITLESHLISKEDSENSEPEELEHVIYPTQKSSSDVWELPSGRFGKDVIRTLPKNAHRYHPSRFSVIRLGEGVRRPESIKREDWSYFQRSLPLPRNIMTDKCEKILFLLAQAESPSDLEKSLLEERKPNELDSQFKFYLDILDFYVRTIFMSGTALRSRRAQESTLGTLLVHPILNLLTTGTGNKQEYHPGEIFSDSSARQRVLRRHPREDEDRPLGQKVDGLFTSGGTEVGIVELSGGPQTADLPRYIKDHVRGLWSMRDLLNDIIVGPDFSSGSFAQMRYVQIFFFHTHGLNVEIWTIDLPVKGVYRMGLLGSGILPITWEDKTQLLPLLPLLWDLRMSIVATAERLAKLKVSASMKMVKDRHRGCTSTNLKQYMFKDIQVTPTKAGTGKNARTLKPRRDFSSSDSNDD